METLQSISLYARASIAIWQVAIKAIPVTITNFCKERLEYSQFSCCYLDVLDIVEHLYVVEDDQRQRVSLEFFLRLPAAPSGSQCTGCKLCNQIFFAGC